MEYQCFTVDAWAEPQHFHQADTSDQALIRQAVTLTLGRHSPAMYKASRLFPLLWDQLLDWGFEVQGVDGQRQAALMLSSYLAATWPDDRGTGDCSIFHIQQGLTTALTERARRDES